MRKLLPISALLLLPLTGFTQADSSRALPEFVLTDPALRAKGSLHKIEKVDSAWLETYRQRTMSDLLSDLTPIFIKSYGPSALATPSFRGAGSSQTAVLWNGFNMQSVMNGQLDLNLLPAIFTDEVQIQYGSSSAGWGSGAVGGAIHLNNQAQFGKGLIARVDAYGGSFGQKGIQGQVTSGWKNFYFSTRLFTNSAENNYPFTNYAVFGNPEQKLSNARVAQTGLLQEFGYKISPYQHIVARLWYQYSYREIPPIMSQPVNRSYQNDSNLRATLHWDYQRSKWKAAAKTGLFNEIIYYADPVSALISGNRAKVWISEAEAAYTLNTRWYFSLGTNYTHAQAHSGGTDPGFTVPPRQDRIALFGTVRYQAGKAVAIQLQGREEYVNRLVPFTPSLSAEWTVLTSLRIKGLVARSYRLPTFNDLYWINGNPSLRPEQGWNEEATIAYQPKATRWGNINLTATVFNRNITDWIMWIPQGAFWSPRNVLEVHSWGTELNLGWNRRIGQWTLAVNAQLTQVSSKNQKAADPSDQSVGQQLIYVPVVKQQAQVRVGWKRLQLLVQQSYTGVRYTSSDNTGSLDPYMLLKARISYIPAFWKCKMLLFAEADNITNTGYQAIADRPMPGRSYMAGISFTIQQPYKH